MLKTRRPIATAIAVVCLAVSAPSAVPSGSTRPERTRPAPTIEPALPVVIDAHFDAIERGPRETTAQLVVEITGLDEISDLMIDMALPADLRPAGPERLPRGPMRFAKGQVRRFVLPVSGDRQEDHAVRLEAVFKDALGRTLRLGQGATLDSSPPAAGRSHLGAFEMMAVPIEQVRR